MKKVRLLILFIAMLFFLAMLSCLTRVKNSDLIAQVCINTYEGESYLLQVTDEKDLFVVWGIIDFSEYQDCADLEQCFKKRTIVRRRRFTDTEYDKVIGFIEEIKAADKLESGTIVERSPELWVYIGDNRYFCPYIPTCSADEKLQRLAHNLVLMSPIKTGATGLKELIRIADESVNGYVNQFGKRIEPIL